MVVDVITFNGEYDLLEIRLNILDEFVDQFVICEARTTFSGKPKPLYFLKCCQRYSPWKHKIKYFIIDENYSDEEKKLAEESPNTKGAAHWKHEFLQKESIKKAHTHLNDDDIVFIGDCDEIWNPEFEMPEFKYPVFINQNMYVYFLNNLSTEEWAGTMVSPYKYIKDECLNHLRTPERKWKNTAFKNGWHFTSMGGYEEVKRKLSDSYTRESYWIEQVENNLKNNVEQRKDFLGRGFTYTLDEESWPQYLKYNRKKYEHLCK